MPFHVMRSHVMPYHVIYTLSHHTVSSAYQCVAFNSETSFRHAIRLHQHQAEVDAPKKKISADQIRAAINLQDPPNA